MKTQEIREKLHNYIENAHEKKLKAIYTMVEEEIDEADNLWNDEEFVAELERREESYLSGRAKIFTLKETISGVNNAIRGVKGKK